MAPQAPAPRRVQGLTQTKINGAYNQIRILAQRLKGMGESRQNITAAVREGMDKADGF